MEEKVVLHEAQSSFIGINLSKASAHEDLFSLCTFKTTGLGRISELYVVNVLSKSAASSPSPIAELVAPKNEKQDENHNTRLFGNIHFHLKNFYNSDDLICKKLSITIQFKTTRHQVSLFGFKKDLNVLEDKYECIG